MNLISATPFGQAPVLYVDDKLAIPETTAIYRYLGAKHGGIPDSLEDQAIADAFGDHIQDFMFKLSLFIHAIMQKKPRERIEEYKAGFLTFVHERFFPDLEKQLEKNGTGWIIGNKPTWIDFMVSEAVDGHLYWKDEDEKEVPGLLLEHRERVFGLPGLEKRVEERKQLFPPKEMFKY